jgi:site-specific DNA-methyltransferase (cytosine-N4-specific)
MCREQEWNLAEEFFWFNPAKLPSPAEWVTKRKIRAKDAVNTIWWLSKTDNPKSDIRQVTVPYSESMKKLLVKADYYTPTKRPSGHDIGLGFHTDNGGALPSNLLAFSNTDSNSKYMRYCKKAGVISHPARFPLKLPEFFIKMLTEERDVVLDIFAGSNATGYIAEQLNRQWLGFELDMKYLAASALRFVDDEETAYKVYNNLLKGKRISRDIPPAIKHEVLEPILATT